MTTIEAEAEMKLVKRLSDIVGPSLTALSLNAKKRDVIDEWTAGRPLPALTRIRLDVALECIDAISKAESEGVARAWFIGRNVGDDETSPCEALRDSRIDEVLSSAQRLVNDGWS